MTTYTIRTRGLIPVIMKRGPMSGIELDTNTLLALVSRGVDIVNDNTGKEVRVEDFQSPDTPAKKIEPVKEEKQPEPAKVHEDPPTAPEIIPQESEAKESEHVGPDETDDPKEDAVDGESPVEEDKADPYAGMSRNQRKKAKKAAAAAAAAEDAKKAIEAEATQE